MSRAPCAGLILLAVLALPFPAGAETGYQPPAGGKTWEELNKEYWKDLTAHPTEDLSVCKSGLLQSPIDLPGATPGSLPTLTFKYSDGSNGIAQAYNTGHYFQMYLDPDDYKTPRKAPGSSPPPYPTRIASVTVNNVAADGTQNPVTYKLLQYHFHYPSEHLLNGARQPMEVHLVHRHPETNKLLVLAVFLRPVFLRPGVPSEEHVNNAYNWWWGANVFVPRDRDPIPGRPPWTNDIDRPYDMLPSPRYRTYQRYAGSLTTPPCTENVTWIVFNTPVPVLQEVFDGIRKRDPTMVSNARPFQTLRPRVETPQ